ncbi:nidogen-like domain-containing protein [Reyranella sp.]|uniref:nidogen-like domain-containing protein n=1 Tax=Reyranella sp. TaxID=1929291 RepID=UPI0037851FBA
MAVTYKDLIVSPNNRWHDGTKTVTYSFPTKVPSYFPLVDYDGKLGDDAVQINEFNTGTVDEIVPIGATILLTPAQQAAAVAAVEAWNEVANINAVKIGEGGTGGPGAPVTGNGTLVAGLGGTTGFGETMVGRGDDGPNPMVSIDTVFSNGLNFFGTTYHDLFVNMNGSVSFGGAVSTYTPTTITSGGTPLIAAFWADIDSRLDTTEPINTPPQVVYDLDTTNRVLTVTWPGVDYFSVANSTHVPKANWFQLQLYDRGGGGAGVGNDFDIVFRYQQIEWTAGDLSGGNNGLNGTAAHAGWTAGNGKNFEEVPASGNEAALLALPAMPGNTGVNGLFVYQVRAGAVVTSDIIFGAFDAYSTNGKNGVGLAGLVGNNGEPVLAGYPNAKVQSDTYGLMAQRIATAVIGTPSPHGDVFVNNSSTPLMLAPTLDNSGGNTFLHEFGHSIGLIHPIGEETNPEYNQKATVMANRLHPSQAGLALDAAKYPITPMVLDIQAAQELYGANLDTRAGDDTYFGPPVFGTNQAYPFGDGERTILTIWDAGGTDWISGANQSSSVIIDLNPGSYSTIGKLKDNVGLAMLWTDKNTGIQYGWIENAIGGSDSDILVGNDLANILDGGQSDDAMAGGKGDDIYIVDHAEDAAVETAGEGTDLVKSSVTFTLGNNVENLTLTGNDDINGTGNDLDNIITGNGAANRLDGKGGSDKLDGGDGADTYVIDDPGDEVIYINEKAGPDVDTVESSITFVLPGSKLLGVGFIENLTLVGTADIDGGGNDFDNVITGNSGNNTLEGQLGNDTFFGGAGDDIYGVDAVGDLVVENPNEGNDTVVSGVDYTLGDNVENLSLTGKAIRGNGNALNNVIFGQYESEIDNILNGGAGLDTMRGFGGNDTYFVDIPEDIIIEDLPGANVGGAIVTGGGFDTVFATVSYKLSEGLEALVLVGSKALVGIGNATVNVITGNEFANILDGGADADEMIGGKGDDTYVVDNVGDKVTEIGGEGTDTVQSFIDYTLAAELENLQLLGTAGLTGIGNVASNIIVGNDGNNLLSGLGGADQLAGGLGDDVLKGGAGDDVLDGGGGTDTVDYSDLSVSVTVDLIAGKATGEGTDSLISIESAIGSKAGDVIGRFTGDGILDGRGGDDTILVAGGRGQLLGGSGVDTLSFASAKSAVELSLELGTATVNGQNAKVSGFEVAIGTDFNDVLTGHVDNERLEGGLGNDTIDGRSGADTLAGGAGSDMLTGGTGDDLFVYGGEGLDTITDFVAGQGTVDRIQVTQVFTTVARVLVSAKQVGVDTEIDFGSGNKLVLANVDMSELDVDDFTLPAGNFIVGTANGDVIDGTTSPGLQPKATNDTDVIRGNGGNDSISSLGGDDLVEGGDGDDTLDAGSGADTVRGGIGDDTIIATADGSNDSYDGGAGIDTVSYAVTGAGLLIDLADGKARGIGPQAGVDTLTEVENAVGGTGDDAMYGSTVANRLEGGAGNDTLDGKGGPDMLVGGPGSDTVVFSAGYGADVVADFEVGIDKLNLSLVASLTDLAAVMGKASQVGKDTVIDLGNGDTLTLQNVVKTSLTAGDVAFASTAPATLSIAPLVASKNEGQSGTTLLTFTVVRSGDTTGTAMVDWSVAGAGAGSADKNDFPGSVLPQGTVQLASGQISQVIEIVVQGDTADEGAETFTVTLANAVAATIDAGHASATGTIGNDDSLASLSIAVLNAVRDEGNSGLTPFTFTVSRDGRVDVAVSALWTVSGSGGNPANAADFSGTLATGSVSFAAGELMKAVTVNVSGDTTVEPDETFQVTLSSASAGAVIGTPSTASGTIVNEDRSVVSIAALAAAKPEGNSGTTAYTFTVSLGQAPVVAQTVAWSVTGSGVNQANAADFGGTLPSGILTFAAGEGTKTLTVNAAADTMIETDEGFTVTLANPSSGLVLGLATAVGTIQTDDSVVAAHGDAYTLHQGNTLVVTAATGVLANDQGATSATVVASATHGALQLAASGGFSYTPLFGFSGIDAFTYRAAGVGGGENAEAVIYVVPVQAGGTSPTLNLLALSAEEQIASTYVTFFGRAADAGGFGFWVGEFNRLLPAQGAAALFSNIASSFGISDEARALYPFLANPFGASDAQISTFLDSVYNNLFNRPSDAGGLSYWTGQIRETLQAGQFVGSVLINIMSGAQDTAAGKDITTLMGKVAVSLAYVREQQEHHTNWLGASDNAAATNLLDPVGSDPASVLTGIRNAEALIAAHP